MSSPDLMAAGSVAFWACVAARSHADPVRHGQALGYALSFALELVDGAAALCANEFFGNRLNNID